MVRNTVLVAVLLLGIGLMQREVFAAAPNEVHVPKSAWDKQDLSKAKKGDFVEYEMPAMPGAKSRQEIVDIGDHTMTYETAMTVGGNKLPASQTKMIYDAADPAPKDEKTKLETKEAADKVTVAKGTFDATRYESYKDGTLLSKAWVSKEIPVTGLVKAQDGAGKDSMVLSDFGRGK